MRTMDGVVRWAVIYLTLANCPSPSAQTPNAKGSTQDDRALQGELTAISQQQKQILDQLSELKQLIAANAAARPNPQPAAPPSALAIHQESFRGDSRAQVALIEYADFECPYCGQFEREIYPQLSSDYIESGKVRFSYRDLPLEMHPHAMLAARAARCAGEQGKYWEMHDSLFAKQNLLRQADMPGRALELGLDQAKFAECLSSDRYMVEINQSASEAHKMGINGTPTFFIGKIDENGQMIHVGKVIMGARPYEAFKSAIDDMLGSKAQ